jgi:hypothetical protein
MTFFSYIRATSNESKTGSHSHHHHHLWKHVPNSPFLWVGTSLPNLIYLTKYCKDHISMAFLFLQLWKLINIFKSFESYPSQNCSCQSLLYCSQIERNKILLDSLNRITWYHVCHPWKKLVNWDFFKSSVLF